jgi:predicted Rossmann fold nucleotide-binding protein DprA/Smf involved in DNA uptake
LTTHLLLLVERLRSAMEETGTLSHDALKAVLQPGETLHQLDQALRFLHGREAILIDGVDHSVHLRSHVTQAVIEALGAGPVALDTLADRIPIGMALCCEVLGWLEREGRVRIQHDDTVALR